MDKYDTPFLLDDINKKMPKHTDEFAGIPQTFGHLPKNLFEYSNQVNEKFLNQHLAEIEEAGAKNLIPVKNFIKYQNKTYGEKYARIKDGFFKADFSEVREIGSTPFLNSMFTFSLTSLSGGTIGADLTTGNTSSHGSGWTANYILAQSVTGTAGHLYDRIATNIFSSAGNEREGVYSDSSSTPDVLLAETGSIASSTDFNWDSVTEFSLTTGPIWLTHNRTSTSLDIYYNNVVGRWDYNVGTFTNFPSDMTGLGSGGFTGVLNMKVGHS